MYYYQNVQKNIISLDLSLYGTLTESRTCVTLKCKPNSLTNSAVQQDWVISDLSQLITYNNIRVTFTET